MFRVGSKIRIVIMIEMESLTASRGGGLVEIATQLHKLFGKEFKNVINSCLLIVSKTNEAVMTMEEII